MQSFDCSVRFRMISCCLSMPDVKHLAQFRLEVNCGPRSEVIVLGTPKREIQEKVKAFAHAAVYVSERGIASIHLDVSSMIVKI